MFDSGSVVHRLCGVQWTLRVLLFWKPHGPRSLHPEAIHTGEPFSFAAGQHRVWGQHPGCLLWKQLQTCYRDQVIIKVRGFVFMHQPNHLYILYFEDSWIISHFLCVYLQPWRWDLLGPLLSVDWLLHFWRGSRNGFSGGEQASGQAGSGHLWRRLWEVWTARLGCSFKVKGWQRRQTQLCLP